MCAAPHSDDSPRSTVTLSRRGLLGLVVLLVLPWAAVLWQQHAPEASPPPTPLPSTGNNDSALPGRAGPWGELISSRIVIEPPDSLIGSPSAARTPITWHFVGYTEERLEALWESAGLSPAQRSELQDPRRREITDQALILRPTDQFALNLSPKARTIIYSALAEFAENPDQNEPYRFRADVADEWFQQCDLRPATVEIVKRLLYHRGTSLLFSDLNLVLPQLDSLAERINLVKTLARKSTLMVKLRLRDTSDIDSLERYWGRGQRSRDIRPILQSLARQGRGATLDIIHLLPRVPRSLLYTYPTADDVGNGTFLDCHWSVLNFFKLTPDERFQHLPAVEEAFTRDYYPIAGKPTFGDVVLFTRRGDQVIHSCVYLADGIVYTKNGAHANAPWILMELSDVVAFYPSNDPLDIQYYRSRSVPVD